MQADLRSIAREAFGVTPDTRFLFMSRSHREALASLVHGIDCDRPFMALIGRPGSGKTTLLFRLLQHYRTTARTAFVFQTQCNSRELLQYLLADCGIDCAGQDVVTMHSQFNQLLLDTHRSGKRFLLFLDEAHNFRHDILEAIRLLSDFETPQKKLLQIIFSGQPAIDEELSRPEMVQLRQRIPLFCRLEPLAADETFKYIGHRLKLVGAQPELFTPISMEMIHDLTSGLPRDIHNVCFGALCLACAVGAEQVDSSMVAEAAHDLGWALKSGYEEPHKVRVAAASAIPANLSHDGLDSTIFAPMTPEDLAVTEEPQPHIRGEPQIDGPEKRNVANALSSDVVAKQAEPETFRDLLLDPSRGKAISSEAPDSAKRRKKRRWSGLIVACTVVLIGIAMIEPSRRLIASSGDMISGSTARLLKGADANAPPEPVAAPESAGATRAGANITPTQSSTKRKVASRRPGPVENDLDEAPWISTAPSDSSLAVTVQSEDEPAPPAEIGGETKTNLASAIPATTAPRRLSQITESRLLEAPTPVYPAAAKRAGVKGVVELEAVIDTTGHLKNIRVVSGNPLLTEAAVNAAKLQRYSPYLLNSEPQEVPTKIRFVFR